MVVERLAVVPGVVAARAVVAVGEPATAAALAAAAMMPAVAVQRWRLVRRNCHKKRCPVAKRRHNWHTLERRPRLEALAGGALAHKLAPQASGKLVREPLEIS